jgi:hypothetical protein
VDSRTCAGIIQVGSTTLERDWMGWEAPAGDGDAVCALDRGWEVAVGAVDGEAERAAELEFTGAAGNVARCKKTELGGSRSCRESQWCSRSTGSGSGGGVGN